MLKRDRINALVTNPAGFEYVELPDHERGGFAAFNRRFELAVSENDIAGTKWDSGSRPFDRDSLHLGPIFIDNVCVRYQDVTGNVSAMNSKLRNIVKHGKK